MGGTRGGSRGTGGAQWGCTEARKGNSLSDGPHRRTMAAVPKVPGMATGKRSGDGEGRVHRGKGRNRDGGVALVLGTAEAAPALLLEALIRPWFGFGMKCGGDPEGVQTLRSGPGSVLLLLGQGLRHPHTPAPHPHTPRGHPNSISTFVSVGLVRCCPSTLLQLGHRYLSPPWFGGSKALCWMVSCFPPSLWRWDKH